MNAPITAALCGAGLRGSDAYGPFALEHPEELRFVAVAEPDPLRRSRFAAQHNIPAEHQYASWEALFSAGKLADSCLVMTQDQMHREPAIAALSQGYNVLLEKPMAHNLADSVALVQAAERYGKLLQICHVLRYTPFFMALNNVLQSGRLGNIINVTHRENVVFWHMAHSFVRGNWGNSERSSPMILAKCCHDLDILFWNMGPMRSLHSAGSLMHYRQDQAPAGATARCTDGCPVAEECPWDARRLYLNMQLISWPVTALGSDLSAEGRLHALRSGPYGRCVYHCDNDVVDHQVVSMETDQGSTVTLIMHGHSHEENRTMRYDGTRATLRGRFGYQGMALDIHDHLTGRHESIDIQNQASGHGGGDFGIMRSFVRAMHGEASALTTARESLESHLMAFAAEESRLSGNPINMQHFRAQAENSSL